MSTVNITNVNIAIKGKSEKTNSNVLGFAEVVIEDSIANKNGKLLSFPAQMTRESKKWYDICYPINQETREHFEKVIFNAYDKLLEAQPKKK
jgi:DNA-binding cell septation regulator SpoVG